MKNYFVITGIILVLTACTTYSKKECETMNWHQKGFDTALEGKTSAEGLDYFQRTCQKNHAVPVKAEIFNSGYIEGLKKFCTSENAEQFAANGGRYRGTCPETAETTKFLARYQSRREEFLEKKIHQLESELSEKAGKISGLESQVSSLESSLSHCQSHVH